MSKTSLKVAQVGFGMFGAHEVGRSVESIVRYGVSPFLGRIGYAKHARELADVTFTMTALGTRSRQSADRASDQFEKSTGSRPKSYYGEKCWIPIIEEEHPDILVVATPDNLHYEPARFALAHGVHVIVEKPLSLRVSEVMELVATAETNGLLLGSDNHKEYDPDHIFIARRLLPLIGPINYGRAYLEEPLEVSTSTFKWIAEEGKHQPVRETPFGYVGIHWVSLFQNMYGRTGEGDYTFRPVHVSGHGQKNLLLPSYGIDVLDSTVIDVTYDSGARVTYENNWITPPEFCGVTVNQGHEIVGANGKVESDQQNRGLVYWVGKHGPQGPPDALSQRTSNTHFFREVYSLHDGAIDSYCGYGMDAITAFFTAVARVMMKGEKHEAVKGTFIDGSSQILPCAVIEAGNASIWKNRELLEGSLPPTAGCVISHEKGIRLDYTGERGEPISEPLYTGKLSR
ncbi:Gfo/Idh/MocA family oxidoreductase [bacterium]|nr:Gfo/Idh/MocA family oxidoreductase [bacterium]